MSGPTSYSALWKPGSSTSSNNTRNEPISFQRLIPQKAPSHEQVDQRANKSDIKSVQDVEAAKSLSVGALTHVTDLHRQKSTKKKKKKKRITDQTREVCGGMSKKVDWEVDEIIILKEDYDLSQLPNSPRCKNLLKLSIQISGFTEIPPTFFEHMPLLEELDLSTTNIQSLPSSISSLTFLRKLFLRDCSVLMELPSEIGMLTKLKLLDCQGSEIMYIPKEIGELNDLEVLRVSLSLYADYYLKTKRVNDTVKIPRNILSKLNKLKELCLTTCPEAEWWEKEVREIQDDLCHLEYLETLTWYLPTKMVLDQFLQIKRGGKKVYENLSNFTLTIGRHPQLTSCLPANLEKKFEKFKKCLKWINAEGNEKDISMIMEWAEALFLSRHWTIVRLSDFDLAKLKYCLLAECNEMETLVEVDELSEDGENIGKVGLESIEYLTVHDMEKFQSIWKGPMGKDSLSRLRILALHTCPKLTTIFTINIAQNLSRLTELTVEDCPNVTSLISNESPNIATGPLIPCLEKIFLLDLPELDSISIFKGKIILEKVDSLLVYNCPKLQYLSVMELPNIQKIKGEKEWWNDLKCDKSKWQNVFEQLKEERNLIEQLAEATNSLQHFHDILSCDAKDEKSLDRSCLGVSETKGQTSNSSTICEEEGLFLLQPGDQEPPNMNLDFDFQPLYSNFVPEFMDADEEESSNQGGGGQRRLWVKERSKGWWEYHNSDECPDDEFKEAFRMSKATFNMICEQLDSALPKKNTMLRMAIPVRQRVAVCLYRLATGDPLRAVSSKFGLGISTCHKLVLEVCAAIRTILMPEYLQWPNKERLEQIKTEYGSISGIPNICGSMYTTHVSIIAPKVSPAAYFNKKHTERNQKPSYSTTVQGVVDPQGVFTDICIGCPGSLPDDKILERSALWQRFNMGYTKNTWVVGNSGYPLLDWLLVPHSHQNLTSSQHLYNEKLGDVQNIAKDAFMRLKGRWVCLQKRTEVKLQDLPVVVGACCVLHNICEMNNETMDDNLKFDLFDDEISLGEGGSGGNSVNAVQVRDSIAHNLLHHSR